MSRVRKNPIADLGWRLEFDVDVTAVELAAWKQLLLQNPHCKACIVGQQSIVVIGDFDLAMSVPVGMVTEDRSAVHQLEVSFLPQYGLDLPEFLKHAGISMESFLQTLSALELRARFVGFLPGFAYLEGLPDSWQMGRRPAPRPRVSAGSFAIAGSMAGIYPLDSPGGWNLLGRTDASLWDERRNPPALIAAGDRVRITPTMNPVTSRAPQSEPLRGLPLAEVQSAGQWSTIVTTLDPSRLSYGMAGGGAFDREAAIVANRAVGNPEEAAVLECALVGPELKFLSEALIAVSGATVTLRVSGMEKAASPLLLREGELLSVGAIGGGARCYLAVRGGWLAPSRLAREAPIGEGETLDAADGQTLRSPSLRRLQRRHPEVIRVRPGPDLIEAAALASLLAASWEVGDGTRRGVRLTPDRVTSRGSDLLPSAGLLFGSVQWNPDGSLTLLGPDHPVTGGYAQPFSVMSDERWKIGQLRPGRKLRFQLDDGE